MGSPEVSGLCKGLCIVIKTQPTFIANKGRLTIGSYCNNPTTAAVRRSRGCPEGGAICPDQFAPEFARAATPWSEVCPQCFVVSSKSRSKHASWLVSPGSWTTGSLCVTTQERTGVRYLWGERRERMLEERVCAGLYWSMVQCQ